jgi:hypothetical protein
LSTSSSVNTGHFQFPHPPPPEVTQYTYEDKIEVTIQKTRCRWKYNIRMDLREMAWEGVDWIYLAQDRDQSQAFVDTVMNLQVP